MESSGSHLKRELTKAEKSLEFMQKEHAVILKGLHQEILVLNQRCSDLQFSLAMQTETQKNTEVQRETIKRLQQQNEDLQAKESLTESKIAELESLLSWERLQHRNQVQSLQGQLDEKETKIIKLSKQVEIKNEVSKLQAQVKQIYVKNSSMVQSSLQDVARRARSPDGLGIRIRRRSNTKSKDGSSEASDQSFDSLGSEFSSLNDYEIRNNDGNRNLPEPAKYISPGKSEFSIERQSRRTQVFRHHNKLSENQGMYSFSTPPISVSNASRRSFLPVDYKASVATLPLINGDTFQPSKFKEPVTTVAVSNLLEKTSPTNHFAVGDS